MGRPEPCVLFSQTFVHSQLEEYVDEVIFAEPSVITACEFLGQNVSSLSGAVTLTGATTPPSFALEVFAYCEGETRFRRLCQPFLYSHSSSNMLEVEAVVTNHLVVRGSYRSLTLVIYGNTAEDLGQFNIEFDLDSSLSNLVSSIEPKLEDIPPLLKVNNLTIEESITHPKVLSLPVTLSDISVETKQLLQLIFKILELSNSGDAEIKVTRNILSVVSSLVASNIEGPAIFLKQLSGLRYESLSDESEHIISDARQELLDYYKILHDESTNESTKELIDLSIESEADLITSKELMEMFCHFVNFSKDSSDAEYSHLSLSKRVILGLSVAFLLCSGRDSCFHFVSGGGMEQLACVWSDESEKSVAITLMLLGVVEQATRYSFGCDSFFGWPQCEDGNVPTGTSAGYCHLLRLLLQKQGHVVSSPAAFILHRLRCYEVISSYEGAVLSILGGLSANVGNAGVILDMVLTAKLQLRKLLSLINSRDMVEDPSPVAHASRLWMVGQTEGLLSYKETHNLIASSNCSFSCSDIDSHLLELLKVKGFLPLSAALLSSPILNKGGGLLMGKPVDVVSSLEAIILSLLFCRSGLLFLLLQPDVSATLLLALRGETDKKKEDSVTPRCASILISKGLYCDPRDIEGIVDTHLRVVNAIDRLLASDSDSEEFLWILWELCAFSRFECGRQALLALVHFPEALSVLMGALHSAKESESVTLNAGTAHLNPAIFHSASEIFEVIVTDSTATSLASWIEHAVELHRALHASSPGSNRKDAPARLLEWIDAGVVYHKNGATGLLQYVAVLVSGGDAHLTSTSIVVSDSMDIDNVARESFNGSDTSVVENLGKIISDKTFDGVTLRDSSVTRLTTALRILAFISENPVAAAALYDEGAMTVIYAVLVNCRFMFERSSNSYDYLIDEGTECNATSDLLLERNREKSLVDLLLPCLVLLSNILQRLKEAKERHRNTKLMNALLRLHQEVSPRLAASAAEMSLLYPDSVLGLGAVCHLIASALACWPIYGWTPGIFNSLLASGHSTSSLVLGPKETCSFLWLLNDFLPGGVSLWKGGKPLLTTVGALAIGSLLGPQKEKQVNWYLQPGHVEVLLGQLMPQLSKIGQIILHYASTSLMAIQDLLQVFVSRLACQKAEDASVLLRPIISWIRCHISEILPSDADSYKVYRLLSFLASLFEHPLTKQLLLKEGAGQMLVEVLERCAVSDGKLFLDAESLGFSWGLPVLKSISLICHCRTSLCMKRDNFGRLSTEDCSSILTILLKLCQTLPVGRELVDCLCVFRDLGSCSEGRSALSTLYSHISSSRDVDCDTFDEHGWRKHPPLLYCWMKLLTSIKSNENSSRFAIDAVGAISSGALLFCIDGNCLLTNEAVAVKFFFGLLDDINARGDNTLENINYIQDMIGFLCSRTPNDNCSVVSDSKSLLQVSESVKSLLLLLQEPVSSINLDDIISGGSVTLSFDDSATETSDYSFIEGFGEKYLWECPEALPERLSQASLPAKRKIPSLEGQNKRARDGSAAEMMAQNAFSRGSGPFTAPAGPTRRDSFRQRKPNTSRPPSMHVDDYVARERNVDGCTNSNVIAIQRAGSTSGRPPSIHVDEFIARQKERHHPIAVTTGEAAARANATLENKTEAKKLSTSKSLKPELDDELQGIDIVFDGEDSESDDKLPFPQPDENLQQLPPVIPEQSPFHDVMEETQSESSASCDRKFFEQVDDPRHVIPFRTASAADSSVVAGSPGFSMPSYGNTSSLSPRLPVDSRIPLSNSYTRSNLQQTGHVGSVIGSPGRYDRKFPLNQPPLPPLPPTPPVLSQPVDSVPSQSSPFVNPIVDVQLPPPTAFNVHSEYMSAFSNSPSFSSSLPNLDLMHARASISSPILSTRPPPPPPTPPHFSSTQFNSLSSVSSAAPYSFYSSGRVEAHPPPPLMPPLPISRPTQRQGEIFSSALQGFPLPQTSLQSIQPPAQLQPLQPPQLLRPPQPPQHPRPPVQGSQSPVQMPVVQQPQGSPVPIYYQSQLPENFLSAQQPVENAQHGVRHEQDAGMSLQDYFSSPEAIQSLLSDREKLCQLLEQHPKLMQMLQQRLGQL